MTTSSYGVQESLATVMRPVFGSAPMRFMGYLGLCAAYLQEA